MPPSKQAVRNVTARIFPMKAGLWNSCVRDRRWNSIQQTFLVFRIHAIIPLRSDHLRIISPTKHRYGDAALRFFWFSQNGDCSHAFSQNKTMIEHGNGLRLESMSSVFHPDSGTLLASVPPSFGLSVCLSVWLPACLSVRPSFCLSACLCLSVSLSLSPYNCIHIFRYPYIYTSNCIYIYIYVCIKSIYIYIYIYNYIYV